MVKKVKNCAPPSKILATPFGEESHNIVNGYKKLLGLLQGLLLKIKNVC